MAIYEKNTYVLYINDIYCYRKWKSRPECNTVLHTFNGKRFKVPTMPNTWKAVVPQDLLNTSGSLSFSTLKNQCDIILESQALICIMSKQHHTMVPKRQSSTWTRGIYASACYSITVCCFLFLIINREPAVLK